MGTYLWIERQREAKIKKGLIPFEKCVKMLSFCVRPIIRVLKKVPEKNKTF
jgi:hypothetical protein